MKELVNVIIPILNPDLSPTQERLLHRCLLALKRYPITFITFKEADMGIVKEHVDEPDIVFFPKEYFESRQAFAKLLLMEDFYERFSWADFLLIHELNSFVVKDELHYWCKQGYDYVRATPIDAHGKVKKLPFMQWKIAEEQKIQFGHAFIDNGLILCHIQRMMSVLRSKNKIAYTYRHDNQIENGDGVFWELESTRFGIGLRKPTQIVRNFFCQSLSSEQLNWEKLPFAITGINSSNIDKLPQ